MDTHPSYAEQLERAVVAQWRHMSDAVEEASERVLCWVCAQEGPVGPMWIRYYPDGDPRFAEICSGDRVLVVVDQAGSLHEIL